MTDEVTETVRAPVKPYRGLVPYEAEDAEFFFGRESETRIITANLFAAPLTLLYGVSGVGKSSVLRAGVARHISGRDDILAAVFADWEKHPREGLKAAVQEAALKRAAAKSLDVSKQPSPEQNLCDFLVGWSKLLSCRISVILDQFEDYLQYHPQSTPFASEFALAVMQKGAPVSFLISIREDSLARLDRFEGSIPILFDNYLRLNALDRQAAQQAIEMPINRYNEKYVRDGRPYSIEPALVTAVLEQVRVGELALGSARGHIQKVEPKKYKADTVYLQVVMTRLWDEEEAQEPRKLLRGTLARLGEAKNIVRTHVDGVMDQLDPEEKNIMARVFRYLVTPTGTKVAYPVNELAGYERIDKDKLSAVLEKLSRGHNRILRPVSPAAGQWPEMRFEIFHDALGPALLDWITRYDKRREQKEALRKVEAQKKQNEKQMERQRRRIKTLIYAVLILLVVAAFLIAATTFALLQRGAAETARAEAEKQRAEAQAKKTQADRLVDQVRKQNMAFRYAMSVMQGHEGPVVCVALNNNNTLAVTGSTDKTARVWDVKSGVQRHALHGHTGAVTDVAFSPDGRYVATASEDGRVRLWHTSDGRNRYTTSDHGSPLTSVSFSPDGKYIVSSSFDSTARLWQVESQDSFSTLRGHRDVIFKAEFSPNSLYVVTASRDGTAIVWNVESGQALLPLLGHTGEVNSAKFNPSSKTIITASRDNTARLWDISTGRSLNTLRGHKDSVNSAEFSPDGEYVVTASSDKTAKIWKAGDGTLYSNLAGHSGKVNTAYFSHEGKRVVTASDDKTTRTWNALSRSRNTLLELIGHLGEVNAALFDSDSRTIITISNDQTARAWNASEFGGFEVTNVYVDPVQYQGVCPASIRLTWRLEAKGGSGMVTYKIIHGQATSPIYSRPVDSPDQQFVTSTLKVRNSAKGELYVEVIEPNQVPSNPVEYRIKCVAPPAKPPAVRDVPAPSVKDEPQTPNPLERE